MDFWSSLANGFSTVFVVLLKLLGYQYPLRTVLGLCLGIVIAFVFDLVEVLLIDNQGKSFNELNSFGFLAIGLVIIYWPLIFEYIKPGRSEVFSEGIERGFAALSRAIKEGRIGINERRRLFTELSQAIVERFTLDPDIKRDVDELKRQFLEEGESEV